MMKHKTCLAISLNVLLACLMAAQTALAVAPVPAESGLADAAAQNAPAAVSAASFAIGSGYVDVIPHQLVRTASDRLYIFAAQAQYTSVLKGYWTTSAGLPNSDADFSGSTQVTDSANIISVDAAYNGAATIFVLVNNQSGQIKVFPFDTASNTFKTATTIGTSAPTVSGDYIGTSGVSGMVDQSGVLHVAYWASGNHITHRAYTYNALTNALALVDGPTQVDTAGNANHPSVAVSPVDNSLTVAWVSQATNPAKILARTRSSSGAWGSIQTVSTASVWISTNFGINVDQGPALVIDSAGKKYLTYIENFDGTGDYGRVHYVTHAGSGWTDQAMNFYSHDPVVAINSAGEVYVLGHGFRFNPACKNMVDMCSVKRNGDGTWALPEIIATPSGANSFDASVSVKWSAVGFNRPETIEFLFFMAQGGNYNTTTVYYGRLGSSGTAPTATALATATPAGATSTATATSAHSQPTATHTSTSAPPTATATSTTVPPTATTVPPTVASTNTPTAIPPTATNTSTLVPPTATNTATTTSCVYLPGTSGAAGTYFSIQAESWMKNTAGSGSAAGKVWANTTGFAGYTGASAVQAQTNSGVNTFDSLNGPRLDYTLNFSTKGAYYVYVYGRADTLNAGGSDSLHVGLDGAAVTLGAQGLTGYSSSGYSWRNTYGSKVATLTIATTGLHTFNIWMREDGMIVDKIVIGTVGNLSATTLKGLAASTGWNTSCQGTSPTSVPPTATSAPPTATKTPTLIPPTATPTSILPTATSTSLPPTATSIPPTATTVPPTATPDPGSTPIPVAGQLCPAWVHDRYTTTGPDGNTYPTWHPQVDPEFGCFFNHEHGDDPRTSLADPGLPAFGYINAVAQEDHTNHEPHNGFKVFVVNKGTTNDEGRTARVSTRLIVHMGTGGVARFDRQFHSLEFDLVADDGHYVHIQGMADTGPVGSICTRDANSPNRTVLTLPNTGCNVDSPYEIWAFKLAIGDKLTAILSMAVFDPITVMNPADHTQLIYTTDAFAARRNEAPFMGDFKGCDREAYNGPVYWYNANGATVYQTDAYGNITANGGLRQEISRHNDLGILMSQDQNQFKLRRDTCAPGLGLTN
jgi:hypothetical protein